MFNPPFKLAASVAVVTAGASKAGGHSGEGCCVPAGHNGATVPKARLRLADLNSLFHCSVIGTCLSTVELRKLMARFVFVRDSSDLEVHHEAVSHASRSGPIAKALQKLLDQRHESVVQRFARVHEPVALGALWDESLRQGEVPGAYWAVLTHRNVTPGLQQQVFGDVHMLSHLVGAANHADIRRLVSLERENGELRERAERQQLRSQELVDERDAAVTRLQRNIADARSTAGAGRGSEPNGLERPMSLDPDERSPAAAQVALQTERRERAEQAAAAAVGDAARLREELDHLSRHTQALGRELAAAETQLREAGEGPDAPSRSLEQHLCGRRIFYVGGRPSSTLAIRDLVIRHGGEFQRHDGGLEDRKGLLASGVAWAELVVFPVDCIDHDSAGNLKRLCLRQDVRFLPLRSASVASFAAALLNPSAGPGQEPNGPSLAPTCLKHG